MDTAPLWSILSADTLPLTLAAVALALALAALVLGLGARRRNEDQLAALRERSDTLWREVDDIRVAQFNRPGKPGPVIPGLWWKKPASGPSWKPMAESGLRYGIFTNGWACS